MIDWLAPRPGEHFLDVAGGTGDIAFRILARRSERRCQRHRLRPDAGDAGGRAATAPSTAGILHGHRLGRRQCRGLPFADRSFDAYTIAFGLRNVTRYRQGAGARRGAC